MLRLAVLLALCVALSGSMSIRNEEDGEKDLTILQKRQEAGCSSGNLHWKKGEVQSEGGVTCTCDGNNKWSCDKELPGRSCYLGSRRVLDGQSYTEGSVTCVCRDGKFKC